MCYYNELCPAEPAESRLLESAPGFGCSSSVVEWALYCDTNASPEIPSRPPLLGSSELGGHYILQSTFSAQVHSLPEAGANGAKGPCVSGASFFPDWDILSPTSNDMMLLLL